MSRPIPVAGPFPDVANHVVEAVAVWLEAPDRRGSGIAVLFAVQHRKEALPGVRDRLAVSIEGARPVILAGTAAARRELPLRFCRQAAATPPRIGERILIGDM